MAASSSGETPGMDAARADAGWLSSGPRCAAGTAIGGCGVVSLWRDWLRMWAGAGTIGEGAMTGAVAWIVGGRPSELVAL